MASFRFQRPYYIILELFYDTKKLKQKKDKKETILTQKNVRVKYNKKGFTY